MGDKKGLTIPCYVCYTFIHLGFHVFLNAHSELQTDMCTKENNAFVLPYSAAARNVQVLQIAEIGVDVRTRTPSIVKSKFDNLI